MDWNEKKYEWIEEQKRCNEHDCINDAHECDTVHPNVAKNVMHGPPTNHIRKAVVHPKSWRGWLQAPKVPLWYFNKHSMRMECFNLSEAFYQMSSNAKLNVLHCVYENLLDENEKSLFLSDMLERQNDT